MTEMNQSTLCNQRALWGHYTFTTAILCVILVEKTASTVLASVSLYISLFYVVCLTTFPINKGQKIDIYQTLAFKLKVFF